MTPTGQRVIANESLAQGEPAKKPEVVCDEHLGPAGSCDPVIAGLPAHAG